MPRILIVDDDPNITRLLSYTLKQEGYDLVLAADGAEALRKWVEDRPDLIILDVMLPKLTGYEVVQRIRSEERPPAHIPIIMLTAEQDVVRGLRAGADDHQVKPFHPVELVARIRSLLTRFAPRQPVGPRHGKVHVYYGSKGGVGTTTISINAAIALHRELGKSVVLIDGNLQFGDHRVFLDVPLDARSVVDVVTASAIDRDLLAQLVVKHDSGVDLLLAPPTPETAELVRTDQRHMPRIMEQLRQMYDYVLIDVDKRLDEMNLDIITEADLLFVVMTADLSCLKNVRLVMETMQTINVDPARVKLVLNRSTAFTGISIKNAENALSRKIDLQIVNEYRGAISALNSGAPFMYTKADSLLGRSVLEFARAVDRIPAAAPPVQPQLAPLRT